MEKDDQTIQVNELLYKPFYTLSASFGQYLFGQSQCYNVLRECVYQFKNDSNDELELYSLSKAAKTLHIGYDKIKELVEEGKIGVVNINGSKKISRKELNKFIEANTVYYNKEIIALPEYGGSNNSNTKHQVSVNELFTEALNNKKEIN